MYANSINPSQLDIFIQDSSRSANVVVSGKRFYVALRDGINEFLFFLIVVLIATFALPFAWLFIYYHRKKLQKYLLQRIDLTTENYAEIRHAHQSLLKIKDEIAGIGDVNIQHVPWFLRGLMKEIGHFGNVIAQGSDVLQDAFDKLDASTSVTNGVFEQIPSETLWENRPKSYEYYL